MKTFAGLALAAVLLAATVTEAKSPLLNLRGLGASQAPPASLGAPDQDPNFGPNFQPSGPGLGNPNIGGPTFGGPNLGPQYEVAPNPGDIGPLSITPVAPGPGVKLCNVKYKDLCHIHPCAVKTIIQVKDPCYRYRPCRDCSPPPMVCIEVCLPPGCPRICGTRDLGYVQYNYGDYKVEIRSRLGRVVVDYDD